jgi:hypothetical protein
VDQLGEAQAALVELDPVLHAAELDVPDDVVDEFQAHSGGGLAVPAFERLVAGQVGACVVLPVDEGVHRVAVGGDGRELDPAVLVLDPVRLGDAAGAALERLAVGVRRVGDLEGSVLDSVPVGVGVPGDFVVGAERAREDEADVALLEQVRGPVAEACFGACVSDGAEAESVLVEVGGLLRVSHPQLEVVPAEQGHEVLVHGPNSKCSRYTAQNVVPWAQHSAGG